MECLGARVTLDCRVQGTVADVHGNVVVCYFFTLVGGDALWGWSAQRDGLLRRRRSRRVGKNAPGNRALAPFVKRCQRLESRASIFASFADVLPFLLSFAGKSYGDGLPSLFFRMDDKGTRVTP